MLPDGGYCIVTQGGTMATNTTKYTEFVGKIENLDPDAIICLADREATEAERRCYSRIAEKRLECPDSLHYAQTMKSLIRFLRYGVKPRGLSADEHSLFLATKTRFESPASAVRPISKKRNFLPAQIIPFRGIIH
jgi:hypothetical protein